MATIYRKVLGYNPLKDSVYMSPRMRRYFQDRLYNELQKVLEEEHLLSLSFPEDANREPDFVDQSTMDCLRFNHHMYQEHEQNLRHEIQAALQRLADGRFGYCVATGKPIGIQRLTATPYAMYCFDVQAEKEGYRQSSWG
ncbi:MAG: TraR/DksA family transcriptional regulator [Proteobacteria bacterium]|nr:TraR/DksA family transcriptional regulator [Pseudomonadota bacterium]